MTTGSTPATPGPTVEAAAAAYGRMVRLHREQSERMAPARGAEDRWAQRAASFRPGRLETPELEHLARMLRPGDTLLDIGAGAGRYAVPLSAHAARVVAVEPSPAMRAELAGVIAAAGRTNIEVVPMAWPPAPGEPAPEGDVSLVANVLYGVEEIVPFLEALERHTRRTCAVITFDRAPSTPDPGLWGALHDEPFQELPALPELLAVLHAMGRHPGVRPMRPVVEPRPLGEVAASMRWVCRVEAGTKADARLSALLAARMAPGGLVERPLARRYASIVWWPPP